MATGAHAAKLIERLAMRSDDAPPVVIIHQNLKEDDTKKMNDTLKDCEFDINSRRHGDPVFLSAEKYSLVLENPTNKDTYPQDVLVIHFSNTKTVCGLTQEGAHFLGEDVAPELDCDEDDCVEVAVIINRILAEEAEMKEWADKLFAATDKKEQVKMVQKLAGEGKLLANLNVRLLYDRTLRFRGQVHENSMLKAIITVGKDEVDAYMKRSGYFGVIFERADRQRNNDLRKIKLPLEWNLVDCCARVTNLPATVKDKVLGIIPSSRGFFARVQPEDEVEVTRELCPELAAEMGPSLGISPNASWTIRGLPKRITRQALIKMLATETPSWAPWFVIPRFATTERTDTGSTWIVDSEEPPSTRIIRTKGTCAVIERYVDTKTMQPRARVWAKPISTWAAKVKSGRNEGCRNPWKEEQTDECQVDNDDENLQDYQRNDAEQDQEGMDTMQDTQPREFMPVGPQRRAQPKLAPWAGRAEAQPATLATARPPNTRPRSFLLSGDESSDAASAPFSKRRFGFPGRPVHAAGGVATTQFEEEKKALQDQLNQRDAMILGLQNTIQQLQATMQAMMNAMTTAGLITADPATSLTPSVGLAQPQAMPTGAATQAMGDSVADGRVVQSSSMWADALEASFPEEEGNPQNL